MFADESSSGRGSDGSVRVHNVAGDKLDDEPDGDDGAGGAGGHGLQRGGVRLHRVQVHAAAVLQVRAGSGMHMLQGEIKAGTLAFRLLPMLIHMISEMFRVP